MALYLIGDIQGCDEALGRLLDTVGFSPSRDRAILLGDLVNRGPQSLEVLRRVMASEGVIDGLLGNHDLHLLAVAQGVRRSGRWDTLEDILRAPDRERLLDWLRRLPLARREHGILMVHAGVLPQWTADEVMALAAEVEAVLCGSDYRTFFDYMYGDHPNQWDERLQGEARLRVIVNALTRLRFCSANGVMEFKTKVGGPNAAPAGCMPWFDVPGRRTEHDLIAFGHWSTLGTVKRPNVIPLDTGCVWGGALSALRVGASAAERELIQVPCSQAQQPR